ncbi:unnamed protein product [Rhodiola kirilowii]
MVASRVEFSFRDAINPAYNPNVDSCFPQPLLPSVTSSVETSLALEGSNINATNPLHKDVLLEKKSAEALRCDICSIICNSKEMLDNHLSGKKHRKKTKAQSPDTSLLDQVKTEHIEGAETKSVKNLDNGALPGLKETQALFHRHVSLKKHALVVDGEGPDTMMLEPSTICAPEVSKMHKPKHQKCSESVADNTCNRTDVHDEIMTDIGLQPQLKADYSAEPMLHASNGKLAEGKLNLVEVCASRASVQVCTVCNIFNYSQESLQKHLAGKIHARNVKKISTVTSSPVSVHPIEILGSNNLKPAREPRSPADPSSVVPVGSMEIEKLILSKGGTAMLSPNVCTLCNIKCNSQELFTCHLVGKKHASKVRKLGSDTHTKGDGASRNFPLVQFHGHDPTVTSHDVEKFNDASSINLMVPRDNNPSEKSADCMISDAALSTIPVTRPKDDNSFIGNDGATLQDYESEANQRASKRGKGVQFAYCDVCEVYCNSSEILSTHKMGKRHLKQLKKLGKLEKGIITPEEDVISPSTIASMDYQDGNKSSVSDLSMIVHEQVEAPKGIINSQKQNNMQKASEHAYSSVPEPSMNAHNQVEAPKGIINSENQNNIQEASQDANVGCTLCKVVCNSQMTLSTHLAGRKHAAMLRKRAQGETGSGSETKTGGRLHSGCCCLIFLLICFLNCVVLEMILLGVIKFCLSDTGRDDRSQKSASIEEDYSSVQNWLKRQIAGQITGHEYDSGDEQFATSVAAAAYAVHSLVVANTSFRNGKTLTKEKSRKGVHQAQMPRTRTTEIAPGKCCGCGLSAKSVVVVIQMLESKFSCKSPIFRTHPIIDLVP